MKVDAWIYHTGVENEDGRECSGVTVTCSECGHETQSLGDGEGSVKRCLWLLREECPRGENYYYEGVYLRPT